MFKVLEEIYNYGMSFLDGEKNVFEITLNLDLDNMHSSRLINFIFLKKGNKKRLFILLCFLNEGVIYYLDYQNKSKYIIEKYQAHTKMPYFNSILQSLECERHIYNEKYYLSNLTHTKKYFDTIQKNIIKIAKNNGGVFSKIDNLEEKSLNWWIEKIKYYFEEDSDLQFDYMWENYLSPKVLNKLKINNSRERTKINKYKRINEWIEVSPNIWRGCSIRFFPVPKLLDVEIDEKNILEEIKNGWEKYIFMDNYSKEYVRNEGDIFDAFNDNILIVHQASKLKSYKNSYFVSNISNINSKYIHITKKDFWRVYPTIIDLR